MNVNNTKKTFNFLKSLDITSINKETELLHPGTHMFWDNEEIRSAFMEYLAVWSKNPAVYILEGYYDQDSNKRKVKESSNEEAIEVGFVDGLLEMYKLRDEIRKARSEIISESVMSSYNHKFGSFLFGTHLHLRSSTIENAILPKKLELDLKKKWKLHTLHTNFLLCNMQH